MTFHHRPSPNHGPRRGAAQPELIVLHYTGMATAQAALDRLCDPVHEVSSHWLVARDGQVWQLVEEPRRAWHAGAGSWGGRGDVNSRSIGIEIDNDGRGPFTSPAMHAVERLVAAAMARWSIPAHGVIGHSDMAPRRKADPGPRFDWRRLARQGLAVWPAEGSAAVDAGRFLENAGRFGWPVEEGADAVLGALRLRFRPGAEGPLDGRDCFIAADLAARFPARPSPGESPVDAGPATA